MLARVDLRSIERHFLGEGKGIQVIALEPTANILARGATTDAFFASWCELWGDRAMTNTFKVGDHVIWNSEAGYVSGRIVKVHKKNVNYKGYIHHASADEPQYEIKSDKTDHIALHKGAALKSLRR
jgi:hypothetical protein